MSGGKPQWAREQVRRNYQARCNWTRMEFLIAAVVMFLVGSYVASRFWGIIAFLIIGFGWVSWEKGEKS